jgi:hypothetical protein
MEEVRRSAKAKIHSIFYRDFKIWALDLMRKEDEKKRKDQEVNEEWMQAERGRGQQTAPKRRREHKCAHGQRLKARGGLSSIPSG